MNYIINKKNIINKFRDYINKKITKADKFDPKNGKEVSPLDKYETLSNILLLYKWLLDNIKLDIRRHYIHNDKEFSIAYNKLISHINNKIRSGKQGLIYLSVNNGKYIFTGDNQQYKDMLVKNKNTLVNVMRAIVDELNSVISGTYTPEDGKVMLRDRLMEIQSEWDNIKKEYTIEEIAEHFINTLPEDIIESIHNSSRFEEFNKLFKEEYNRILSAEDNYFFRKSVVENITEDNINDIISDVRNSCAMAYLGNFDE